MTNRSSVALLLAVLAAIAVGAWLVLSGAGARSPAQAAGPHAPGANGVESDEAMRPVGRPESGGAGRGQVEPVPVAPRPSTEIDPDVEPPPADAIEILVRVRETKAPVAGAVVLFGDWSLLSEEEQLEIWWTDGGPLAGLERLGKRYRADEHGIVRVPRPEDGGMVTCSYGELFAQIDDLGSDPSARRTLDLVPDRAILARVVDADGRPAEGVGVGVRVSTRWWSWDLVKARSGPDGIAQIAHAQTALQQEYDASQHFALGIVMNAHEPVEVVLDPAKLPDEPVELRLPPCGSIEVVLDPPSGGAELPEGLVTVFLQESNPQEGGYQSWSPRPIENGRALFSTVGLGLAFHAMAQSTAFDVAPQEFSGPTTAGERTVVHLSVGATRPRVRGRALLDDGSPLADARLRGTLQFRAPENDWNASFVAQTDADGRFAASIGQVEDSGSSGALELSFEDQKRGKLAGTVPLAARLVSGDNDIGDVRLAPPPLLVSGRVIDGVGNGVRGARITLEAAGTGDMMAIGYAGVVSSSVFHWGGLSAVSIADGYFEVRGEMEADAYQLSVTHADYRTAGPIDAQRGQSVLVTLEGAGRIAGRIEGEPGISIANVQVQALDASGLPVQADERRENDGRFELQGLSPGSYAIRVFLADEDADLARIDDIVVAAGETTEDPRLDPVDVSGKLARITLHVSDRDGNPPDQIAIARRAPGSTSYGEPGWFGGSDEIVLVTAERALDLRIEAAGSRTIELFAVSGAADLTLGVGIPIELDLSSIQSALGAGYGLYVEIVHLPEGQGRMDGQAQADERGIAACTAGEPGAWGVHAYVMIQEARDPDGATSAMIGDSLLATIPVQDSGTKQTFVLTAEPALLERALSELGG